MDELTYFNLRRDNNTNDVDFDNDEVTTKDIEMHRSRYMSDIVNRVIDGDISTDEIVFFKKHCSEFDDDPFYQVPEKDLQKFIFQCIKYIGEDCNLNWLDVSNITDMSYLFAPFQVSPALFFNGDISRWDVSNVTNMHGIFINSRFNGDISDWDVSNVENMNSMFYDSKFNGDISKWDVSNVTDMECMFSNSSFNGDISKWDVSNVKDMSSMFQQALLFNKDISELNISAACNTEYMFSGCPLKEEFKPKCLEQLSESISNFNLRRDNETHDVDFDDDEVSAEQIKHTEMKYKLQKLADKMCDLTIEDDEIEFFKQHCSEFDSDPFYEVGSSNTELVRIILVCRDALGNNCDLNWIDVSRMTDMTNIFGHATTYTFNGDISKWDVSHVTDMTDMFRQSYFNGDISKWNVSDVVNMHSMFYGSKFNGDISKWNVSKVEYMQEMFSNSVFNGRLSNWNVSNVRDMSYMFKCSEFNKSISKWDVSNVTDMTEMFYGAAFNKDISNWDIRTKNTEYMFMDSFIKEEYRPKALKKLQESANDFKLRQTDIKPVTFNDDNDVADIYAHIQDKKLLPIFEKVRESIKLSPEEVEYWNQNVNKKQNVGFYTVQSTLELKSIIKQFIEAFGNNCNLNWLNTHQITTMFELFDHTIFNGDISKWDVSHVTDMSHMFANSTFNGDISKWDVSNVKTMNSMFFNAPFNGNLSKWDVSGVRDMSAMFGCTAFNGDISEWDTGSVTSMKNMFAFSKFNGDIHLWDVSCVTDMESMFTGSEFNRDISVWDVSNVVNMNHMFADAKFDCDISCWQLNKNVQLKQAFSSITDNDKLPNMDFAMFESSNEFKLVNKKENDVDFDDDEVSTEEITHNKNAVKMQKYVNRLLDSEDLSDEDWAWIGDNASKIDRTVVTPSNGELLVIVYKITEKLPQIDLNWIDTRLVTNIDGLFRGSEFTGDISKWDVSNVTVMRDAFAGSYFNGDISDWDVSNVTDMAFMFYMSKFNNDISRWDVSNVVNMKHMFNNSDFTGDISNWDVQRKANTEGIFKDCQIEEINKPKILQLVTESFTNFNLRRGAVNDVDFDNDEVSLEDMSYGKSEFMLEVVKAIIKDNVTDEQIKKFRTYVGYFKKPFYKPDGSTQLHELITKCINYLGNDCDLNWIDVSGLTSLCYGGYQQEKTGMFEMSDFNGDISRWDVSKVKDMGALFCHSKFNGDISKWDVSSVENMSNMFGWSPFNGDISKWNVSHVKDMTFMFTGSKFNDDISNWDVSNVTNMYEMFRDSAFNGDISRWDVSNVKRMDSMFAGSPFNGDISKWDVSNVEGMYGMFSNSQFNQDISAWDTHNVTSMAKMFSNSKFNQDISNWWVTKAILSCNGMFNNCPIKKEFKPKALQNISESVSNFNLRRDNRGIDFDDDEVTVDQIKDAQAKYSLPRLIAKIADGTISKDGEDYFNEHFTKNKYFLEFEGEPLYRAESPDALKKIIEYCVERFGRNINLNWIDVSHLTHMNVSETTNYGPISIDNKISIFSSSRFNGDISKWDVSNVEDMESLFSNSSFNGDISKWNVSHVTNMHCMFCNSYFNGDISKWNVSSVTDMDEMFYGSQFNNDISEWDVSNVESMNEMFKRASFDNDISKWDVHNVKEMKEMFQRSAFDQDISKWDVRNVKYMYGMFEQSQFNNDISQWNVSNVETMYSMFKESYFNGDISEWDVSNVKSMAYMFKESKFNSDISKWDVSNVSNAKEMFLSCPIKEEYKPRFSKNVFESVSNFNLRRDNKKVEFDDDVVSTKQIKHTEAKYKLKKLVAKIIDETINEDEVAYFNKYILEFEDEPYYQVESPDALKKLIEYCVKYFGYGVNLNWIDVSNITDMGHIFQDSNFNGDISKWDVSNVTNMEYMFVDSNFNGDISKWDVSNVTCMRGMFEKSPFNGDISQWNTSNVRWMDWMFQCTEFNHDLSQWDVSNVENMNCMFSARKGCDRNKLNISKWNVSKVQQMQSMFSGVDFNNDISKWNVSHVQNMRGMFKDAKFNGDISRWDISHVTDMQEMFKNSTFNGDISKWDVREVSDMSYMFQNSEFNSDISGWNVRSVKRNHAEDMFTNCPIEEKYKPKKFQKKLSESVDFTLRDGRTNNVDFDNDEVSVEQMKHSEMKYKLKAIVDKLRSRDPVDEDEADIFNKYSAEFNDEHLYVVQSTSELKSLIEACVNALTDECNLNWIDTSSITNMHNLFYWSTFNGDISKWDVSHVTNMKYMFQFSNFNGDISQWDVSKVTNMKQMFDASEFNGDISAWDVSNVTNMYCMFQNSSFNGDISNWDVSSVANMHQMFEGAKNFNQNLSQWHISSTADTGLMFNSCPIVKEYKPGGSGVFVAESVSNFNLRRDSKDIDFDDDEVSVDQIKHAEAKHRLLKLVDRILNGVINQDEIDYFNEHCIAFEDEPFYPVKEWIELRQLVTHCMDYLGSHCNLNWINTSQMTCMCQVFQSLSFNGDISKWDVSNVVTMRGMFNHSSFNGDISNWDVSNVQDMSEMFIYSGFNGDISKWDVSNVERMESMFAHSTFNSPISNWNTAKLKYTSGMFYDNKAFDQPIGMWDMSHVKKMDSMFYEAEAFNQDISTWDVSYAKDMKNMFWHAKSFNSPLNDWDVSNVKDMSFMFAHTAYNQPLDKWDVRNVLLMDGMFHGSTFDQNISEWVFNEHVSVVDAFSNISSSNRPDL